MPTCPICGKKLNNPNNSSHIRSQFHQEALKKKEAHLKEAIKEQGYITEEGGRSLEELEVKVDEKQIQELQENLLDEYGYLKVSELEFLKGYEGDVIESLVTFLKTQIYQISFKDLKELFKIIDLILSFLTFEDISEILLRFEQDTLKYELKDKIYSIEAEVFTSTPYSFDLAVHLVTSYLRQEEILEFLINFDELEDILENSYYETSETDANLTTMAIEKVLEQGLKHKDQEVYNNAILIINNSGAFFEHLKKELLNTYRINQYITLKLVGNRTNIYVKNQLFNQCKYLLLNLERSKFREYSSIDSIDEAVERLDARMHGREGSHNIVPPETEFWGHCSNLQAWVENNYDTRILHRNMAFPLLRKLTEVGDPIAKQVYKNEIASRFQSNYAQVIEFIIKGNYLKALNKSEIDALVEKIDFKKFEESQSAGKQRIIEILADLGSPKAKKLMKKQLEEQLRSAKLSELIQILAPIHSPHFRLGIVDIKKVYDTFLRESATPGNEELKVILLNHFVRLGIKEAHPLLKKKMADTLIKQKDIETTHRRHYHRRPSLHFLKNLNVFSKEELEEVFEKFLSSLSTTDYNETLTINLDILP